jgi:UrcA family protein
MLKLATAIAAALALAAPLAAAAQPAAGSNDIPRVVVKYGDLNLATPEGAQALRDRVDRAATVVVGYVDPRDLQRVAEERRARAAARQTADEIIAAAMSGPAYAANNHTPKVLRL